MVQDFSNLTLLREMHLKHSGVTWEGIVTCGASVEREMGPFGFACEHVTSDDDSTRAKVVFGGHEKGQCLAK